MEKLIQDIAKDYKTPSADESDRNGNTKLSILRKRYHLSSLKLQKILITAGVYEPVKNNTSYEKIKALHAAGKSMEEMMNITGLSKAVICAYLPYEGLIYNADEYGGEISNNAKRKRKQRRREDMVKDNAKNNLIENTSDDGFWIAIREHSGEYFITEDGERYKIRVVACIPSWAESRTEGSGSEELIVRNSNGDEIILTKDNVLEVFHTALEEKARMIESKAKIEGNANRPENTPDGYTVKYIYPLLIYFDIISGDKSKYSVKRIRHRTDRCSCCGRPEKLYDVSNYVDLLRLKKQLQSASGTHMQGEKNAVRETEIAEEYMRPWQEDLERKEREEEKKISRSKVVRMFDSDGKRRLCQFCVQTIYHALSEGDAAYTLLKNDYDSMPKEMLLDSILQSVSKADGAYKDLYGNVLSPESFDNESTLLYKCLDNRGTEHLFALTVSGLEQGDGNKFLIMRAEEVHKLTKAGHYARGCTDTDYMAVHGKMVQEGEDLRQKMYAGLIELEQKVKDMLNNPTLDESEFHSENALHIGDKYYTLSSVGQFIPIYVGEEDDYRSLDGHEWNGGDYGFLIDGMLISGEAFARMWSANEGWIVRFQAVDAYDDVLKADEYLMPVRLSEKALVDDTLELINMFCHDGTFISNHDRRNFIKLFDRVLDKLKFYHENNPRGYGKLAGMGIIKRLEWIEGTEALADRVREIIIS